jgi:hypothetical protein
MRTFAGQFVAVCYLTFARVNLAQKPSQLGATIR